MTRLNDERIAEIEKLATALLPRGDWLVFEVADVIGEFRGACKDLLAEVKSLKKQNDWLEKIRWMHNEDAQFMLDEISRVSQEVKALKAYNNCITLKRRKEHDTEETIF